MLPYKSVHFIGVLTPQMASLAVFTARLGIKVTASDDHTDTVFSPVLEQVEVRCFDMFAQVNIAQSVDLVVVSPFYDNRHVEVVAAGQLSISVVTAMEYTKLLAHSTHQLVVLDDYEGPLVASYLTHILRQGHVPINSLTSTVSIQEQLSGPEDSEWFVMALSGFKRDVATYEASFLSFDADMVVVPTIRYDFPELNMTLDDVYDSYYRFVKKVPRKGVIIGNSDYSRMKRLRSHLADRRIETYGHDSDAQWRIRDRTVEDGKTTFSLSFQNQLLGPITIPSVTPMATVAATAAAVAALSFEMKPEVLVRGLATLPQLKRYFEVKVDNQDRYIIDDQADHPETIAMVLQSIRDHYPVKRIWCLYQPGSYLRTKALLGDLIDSLSLADTVYIADIKGYPKEKSEGMHSRHVVAEMKRVHAQTYYIEDSTHIKNLINDRVARGDCIITLGADGVCQQAIAPLLTAGDN